MTIRSNNNKRQIANLKMQGGIRALHASDLCMCKRRRQSAAHIQPRTGLPGNPDGLEPGQRDERKHDSDCTRPCVRSVQRLTCL